jgi:hypothetical protein
MKYVDDESSNIQDRRILTEPRLALKKGIDGVCPLFSQ